MSRRRAVVTGAGRRVGRAIALELAAHGFDVALHYNRSEAPAREVAALCGERGADAFLVQGDLGTTDFCHDLVAQIGERWDGVDLLVNNASVFEPVPFEQIELADWERMQAINLRAPFLLSQGLLPLLRAADGALVVHMCDIGADRPVSGYAHYSVSKAGLVMLVKAMAVELAPEVRTVGVSPGQVIWPDSYGPELREHLAQRIPMKRVGSPEDIARLIRFLATEAPYVNGAIIPVDGGLSKRY